MTLRNKILGTLFALFVTGLLLTMVKLTMGIEVFIGAIVVAIAVNLYVAYRTYVVNKVDDTTDTNAE
jgi:hypothetical protein